MHVSICLMFSSQFKWSSNLGGFVYFQKPEILEGAWLDWRTWPHLNVSWDHGPENVSSFWWFQFRQMNLTAIWDFSHGGKLDWKGMLNDLDMFPFWLIYLIAQNCACGPLSDGTRWKALLESWNDIFKNYTKLNPLFQSSVCQIINDQGGPDQFGDDETCLDRKVWQYCKDNPPVPGPTQKINLNRFWASHQRAREDLQKWGKLCLNFTHLALEEGLLATRSLKKIVVPVEPPENDETAKASTDNARAQYDDKAIRGMPKQAVIAGVHIFSDIQHNRIIRVLTMAANPTEGWHRYQSSQLRDVASNSAWLIAQTSGGFFEHVRETMNLPFSRAACQNCGIECPAEFELDPHDVGGLEIVRQDDLSALFGDAALSMATRRLVRCIWLWRGWPTRFAALCGGDAACERVVDEFKADLEAFRFVSDMRDKSNKVLDRLHRSPFTHVTVDQYVEAFLIMFIHSVFLAHRQ